MQAAQADLTDKLSQGSVAKFADTEGQLVRISGLNQFSFVESGWHFFGVCVIRHGE